MGVLTQMETWRQLWNALSFSLKCSCTREQKMTGRPNDPGSNHFITGSLCLNHPRWRAEQTTFQSCNPEASFHFSFNVKEKVLSKGGSQVGQIHIRRGFESEHSHSVWKKLFLHLWILWSYYFQVERELQVLVTALFVHIYGRSVKTISLGLKSEEPWF